MLLELAIERSSQPILIKEHCLLCIIMIIERNESAPFFFPITWSTRSKMGQKNQTSARRVRGWFLVSKRLQLYRLQRVRIPADSVGQKKTPQPDPAPEIIL